MARNPEASPAKRAELHARVTAELLQRRAATSRFLAEHLGATRHMVTTRIKQMLAEGIIHEAGAIKKFSSRHQVYAWGPAADPTIDWRGIAVAQLLLLGPQTLQTPAPIDDGEPPLVIPDVPHATTFVGGVNPWKGIKMK